MKSNEHIVDVGFASKMDWQGPSAGFWLKSKEISSLWHFSEARDIEQDFIAAPSALEVLDRLPVFLNVINGELLGAPAHLKIIKDEGEYFAGYYDLSHQYVSAIVRNAKTLADALAQVYITLKFKEKVKDLR